MHRKHRLDLVLIALTLLCVGLMFIASTDPLPESLRGTAIQPLLSQFSTGNQIVFDLAVGIVCSVVMYVLVVRVPENAKRLRHRANLKRTFDSCKLACIEIFLSACHSSWDSTLPKQLLEQAAFKAYFKEPHAPGQDRWHGVANGLSDAMIRKLIVELEILMNEVQFTLGAVDVSDESTFAFFKNLSHILYRNRDRTADYDDVKNMLSFFWSVHTGWSFVSGYPDRDIFADMIAAI